MVITTTELRECTSAHLSLQRLQLDTFQASHSDLYWKMPRKSCGKGKFWETWWCFDKWLCKPSTCEEFMEFRKGVRVGKLGKTAQSLLGYLDKVGLIYTYISEWNYGMWPWLIQIISSSALISQPWIIQLCKLLISLLHTLLNLDQTHP